ncbi:acyl-CoA dehydrogenase-like protein [Jatrophihabitans sp. GAS493]|uniref:acyl-CoA dehydrogenase family protein n=1 Tax=Jatrophihabitans sp. GAS493 TaxID=1907575 RepID=UPI000BB7996C|nr:acyl-CoA dehydrogenase family protein [Jatrophihabitans sp. GAS493]SOD72096.1 acyl-CoA dehydrogenase-like protein [Jatrophihabitans sp. GAS493]
MNREWPAAARELELGLRDALDDLGAVNLARAAEADPTIREKQLKPALEAQGVLELDPFGDEDEAAAAVLAARALGAVMAPWPIAATLAAQRLDADALYVVDGAVRHLEHANLATSAIAVGFDGAGARICVSGDNASARLDPFGTPVTLGDPAQVDASAVKMRLVLDAFYASGAMNTATSLAARYALDRRQFGKSIGQFGEIRWRLADMTVANDGLGELAAFTWYLLRSGTATTADVLALRVGMLETIDTVLKNGHQIFGAIGLCEEHDLVVIDRHITSLRVRPAGATRTAELLLEAINKVGFDAIYPVPARR